MKQLTTLLLILLPLLIFSQTRFEAFKEKFETGGDFPIQINEYAEENEISRKELKKYFKEQVTKESGQYETWYFHKRFETSKWVGFIATRYSTSGAAGVNHHYIELITTSLDGKFLDKKTLGCFCNNFNMNANSELSTKVAININYGEIAVRSVTSEDGMGLETEDDSATEQTSIFEGKHTNFRIGREGKIEEVNKRDLVLIEGQSADYQLLTAFDSTFKKYYSRHFGYSPAKLQQQRTILDPLVQVGDPIATYKYAQTYDLFQFGRGTEEDRDMALKYYSKAADLHYAEAEEQLYNTYRYEFMGVKKDSKKAYDMLRRTIEHSDGKPKKRALFDLAGVYYEKKGATGMSKEFPEIELNLDSTKAILNRLLTFDPENGRARDFLGGINAEGGDRQSAITEYLKSDNINMRTKAAMWLIRGDGVAKDFDRGLEILKDAFRLMEAEGINNYMGSINPQHKLNWLHYCDKLITKEQLGAADMGYFICSEGG